MNNYHSHIFDGNGRISPLFVILLTFGIIFCAAVPPVGVVLVVLALVVQRRFRRHHRMIRRAAEARQAERELRDWTNLFQKDF